MPTKYDRQVKQATEQHTDKPTGGRRQSYMQTGNHQQVRGTRGAEYMADMIIKPAFITNRKCYRQRRRHWILYFGILFILVVFFFPKGFVGTARDIMNRRKEAARRKAGKDA